MASRGERDATAAADEGVMVLAPLGRDAAVVSETLALVGIACVIVRSTQELVEHLRDRAHALLVTEEALDPESTRRLLQVLGEQPPWSDLPIVLLLAEDSGPPGISPHLAELTRAHNVSVLQRPTPALTLITAVQVALRARQRQYQVLDLLSRERRAREDAETATRIKDEFLANVSHELRTPLSAILIWSQMLDAGRLSGDKAARALHAIATSAQVQSRLIEDLLDVSRMLTGKLQLDVRPRSLRPIVEDAIEVVRPMADNKGVALVVQLDDDEVVLADAERVQQVFWNLLNNAMKFTPRGGVVSIALSRARDLMSVTIADSGEGITPELLPHIFERFRRGEAEGGARREGGLGLGLPIVRELVHLHGGNIDVSSPGPGRGATFVVRFPVYRVASRADRGSGRRA